MTKQKQIIIPFEEVLSDLLAWFEATPVKSLIIGGVALSILGRPRLTRDVDALVLLDSSQWKDFIKNGKEFGFLPRIKEAFTFAQQRRVLLMHHVRSSVPIDISFGALPFEEESIRRSKKLRIKKLTVPYPTIEDFVIMKAVAHRGQDLVDIETVLNAHSKIDLKRIRKWAKEFSEVLEMPEIYRDLNQLLKKNRRPTG